MCRIVQLVNIEQEIKLIYYKSNVLIVRHTSDRWTNFLIEHSGIIIFLKYFSQHQYHLFNNFWNIHTLNIVTKY